MSVDAATVRRIAHLSRIAVADEEVEHLRGELNAILAFVEQLGARYLPIPSGLTLGFPFVLLILFLFLRPSGLIPPREAR